VAKKLVKVEEVVNALIQAAQKKGRQVTPRGRKEFRKQVAIELDEIEQAASPEKYEKGEASVEEAAEELLSYAEKNGEFESKTRVGTVVVENTVKKLREEHEKTGVCAVWPFC